MGTNKKTVFLLILFLLIGIFTGYYYGSKKQPIVQEKIISQNMLDKAEPGSKLISSDKKDKIKKKLKLLKSYTDFVLLPPDSIKDPVSYADDMGNQVKSIDDDEISARFYATGEKNEREQKVLDFLDFLNASIQSELQ